MVAIGAVDPVERGAAPLADVLGYLEVIIRVIPNEPAVGEVGSIRKRRIQANAQNLHEQQDFKPVFSHPLHSGYVSPALYRETLVKSSQCSWNGSVSFFQEI
jgi:hypothetical protein